MAGCSLKAEFENGIEAFAVFFAVGAAIGAVVPLTRRVRMPPVRAVGKRNEPRMTAGKKRQQKMLDAENADD